MENRMMKASHYRHLGIMSALSFIAMFVLMYAMVDSASNVFVNVNQFYMAGLMTAPMVLIELFVMRTMYTDTRLNAIVVTATLVFGMAMFMFIRQQTAVSDRQFLRSMIPHHGGAILMCGRAPIEDAEIKKLCQGIMTGQQAEIDQMVAALRRLNNR
jgi:DUF305 family protein family protein